MILEEIAEYAACRVQESKRQIPLEIMREKALSMDAETGFPVEKKLKEPGIHFICEVKKASPSKGVIAEHFPYLEIAEEYEKAGASVISCLTEPKYFQGSDAYLKEIAGKVSIPVLRKDFTVDPYQIYEAKVLGASMVLLICSLLDTDVIAEYLSLCDNLGLSALGEVHDEEEMESALKAKARIIGVNNRNLKDFTVDIHNSTRLRALAPEDKIFVAESGIKTSGDIRELEEAKVNAVLIGETLMRSKDKSRMLKMLRGMGEYD